MEYKNTVLNYFWDQPIVQVFKFLRNKQLLSVLLSEGAWKEQESDHLLLVWNYLI